MTLEFGERLCATYEAYCTCFPQAEITIEDLLSLVFGLAENREVGLGQCPLCGGTVLIDRLARHRPTCIHCEGVLADGQAAVIEDAVEETSE